MLNFCSFFFLLDVFPKFFIHEQWFFSKKEILAIDARTFPSVLTQIGFFNTIVVSAAILMSVLWVYSNKSSELSRHAITNRIEWSAFILRITTGSMLFLSGLGFLPAFKITSLNPTLLAPDLILPSSLSWLGWVEITISLLLILGLFTRCIATILLILVFIAFYLFGTDIFQYFGFYLGICIFLIINGSGKMAISRGNTNIYRQIYSITALQTLTGLNFIYSAISMKLLRPNLDIILLERANAYSFGLSYDYFSFLMFVVEATFGVLFIIGVKLNILSIVLLGLFTFLSWNLQENVFLHLFIYGILLSFVLLQGNYIFKKKAFALYIR